MKLEVGMYARTKRDIGKVTDVYERLDGNMVFNIAFNTGVYQYYFTEIKKASHNIIELIEKKDVIKFEYDGTEYICDVYEYSGRKDDLVVCCETNVIHIKEVNDRFELKSILTKEQFEQRQYKVGE